MGALFGESMHPEFYIQFLYKFVVKANYVGQNEKVCMRDQKKVVWGHCVLI